MDKRNRWSRVLVIVGLVAMVLGAIDPLEGSLVILPGSVLVTVGALLGGTRYKKLILWSLALVVVGIAALWGMSAIGGFGDTSGRSNWWALVMAPYPVGWVMGIVGAILNAARGEEGSGKARGAVIDGMRTFFATPDAG